MVTPMTSTHTTARPTIMTAGVHFSEESRIIRRSVLRPQNLQNIPTFCGEYDHARRTEDTADYVVCPQMSSGSEVTFRLEETQEVTFTPTEDGFGLNFEVADTLTGKVEHVGRIAGYARVTIA